MSVPGRDAYVLSIKPASADGFRRALGSLAAGINVITFLDASGRPQGMTATAMCSVSLDPMLILVCVNRSTRSHDEILARGRFGVSILGLQGHAVSQHCARPGADKRLDESWLIGGEGCETPMLRQALAHLDCVVHETHAAGTHSLILGRVERLGAAESGEPLVHFRGGYRQLADSSATPSLAGA